ncbi:MAG: SMI1/KNR4 family protein [Verrucomicrobia bacterium]|nr:SMI1/KNR4 family protein [Verrucomicrobiota bacterium]
MNSLIRQFFSVEEKDRDVHFHEVFFIQEQKEWTWEDASKRAPNLPRPWFELSRVSPEDRLEFVRDYWLDLLPFHPIGHAAIADFFQVLDDVGVVIHRQSEEDPFESEMVYSLADNSCFFRGLPPATEGEIEGCRREISSALPRDYLSFFQIHNGFGKLSELGLLKIDVLQEERRKVANLILTAETPLLSGGKQVDPGSLIPFFEAFGLASYQCFYADWYPGSEMGNVYLSGIDYTVSDTSDRNGWAEELAFPTFTEWLVYYLEGMSISKICT